ncbi:MAG TPA: glycosyltransferase family 39 protein, partial [Thermoanaerobaculaceae bacterium]|nr:glycosyltransferase family 39 protein [Thermoanaerobaculaceae bacterium]
MPRAQRERFFWLGLALAALLPRALGAVVRPPWHDEYFTVWAAGLPLNGLMAALRLDSGPPLPYLLVKFITIFEVPALFAARALAVAAGTVAVLLVARAARRAFGAEAGWWAGILLAFHPLAVAWSCEGRAYALVLLAVAWAWDRLQALAEGEGGTVGLALAVALACWCHGLGLLLATVLAVVGVTLPRPPRWRAGGAV